MQTVCMEPNLDCQDPNARRAFATTVGLQQACAEFVGWVKNNAVFEVPTAIVDTSESTVAIADCQEEITSYTRYRVKAGAPEDGSGDASWKLTLTRSAPGFSLSAVLGSPPRDPWRA